MQNSLYIHTYKTITKLTNILGACHREIHPCLSVDNYVYTNVRVCGVVRINRDTLNVAIAGSVKFNVYPVRPRSRLSVYLLFHTELLHIYYAMRTIDVNNCSNRSPRAEKTRGITGECI